LLLLLLPLLLLLLLLLRVGLVWGAGLSEAMRIASTANGHGNRYGVTGSVQQPLATLCCHCLQQLLQQRQQLLALL
jgi:hypothetical protein